MDAADQVAAPAPVEPTTTAAAVRQQHTHGSSAATTGALAGLEPHADWNDSESDVEVHRRHRKRGLARSGPDSALGLQKRQKELSETELEEEIAYAGTEYFYSIV
jgi:hypothetical protein